MATRTRFAIIGTGFRARAFLRLSAALPESLEAVAVLSRHPAAARHDPELAGLVVHDLDALLAREPAFVLTAVAAQHNVETAAALLERGAPVLAETPASPDIAGLHRLWRLPGAARIQVAEQYPRHPMTAARLAAIRAGRIGTPTSAVVSIAQTYHAIAVLRAALDAGFGEAEVCAHVQHAPLVAPRTRAGWTHDDAEHDTASVLATLDFGGAVGVYDFTDGQTRNPLRSSRFLARGSRGEIADDRVTTLVDATTVVESTLVRRVTGADRDFEAPDLEHIALDGEVVVRNAASGARLSDDEIAMAELLTAMGRFATDAGPAPYPLAEAAQDQLLGLAVESAAATGEPVRVDRAPWAS
ncbi:hypothetical protein GCM10009840_30470 [Pseudolysinimonas kribbensis]|uniref:Gfo/Idh/MocA family oxidoreductase n=1 Tax=Pseudolysinimonas kribbensis TaxID=433641 RepID=UPI0031D1869F